MKRCARGVPANAGCSGWGLPQRSARGERSERAPTAQPGPGPGPGPGPAQRPGAAGRDRRQAEGAESFQPAPARRQGEDHQVRRGATALSPPPVHPRPRPRGWHWPGPPDDRKANRSGEPAGQTDGARLPAETSASVSLRGSWLGPASSRTSVTARILYVNLPWRTGFFSYELEQGGAAKVVAAIKEDHADEWEREGCSLRCVRRPASSPKSIKSAARRNGTSLMRSSRPRSSCPDSVGASMCVFSRAQLGSPCSRAMVSWASLKVNRAENKSSSATAAECR